MPDGSKHVKDVVTEQSYRGADKSLAQPGRKQATATKLWLLQATQEKFRRLSVQPGLRGSNDLHVRTKNGDLSIVFQSGRAKDLSAPLYNLVLCTNCIVVVDGLTPENNFMIQGESMNIILYRRFKGSRYVTN
jgi:hypothetical protein